MTITEFLLARIAEDETAARDVENGTVWSVSEPPYTGRQVVDDTGRAVVREDDGGLDLGIATYVAHFDPARVLAECEAKRRIMERWSEVIPDPDRAEWGLVAALYWDTLVSLARPYADHPDFDDSWRP